MKLRGDLTTLLLIPVAALITFIIVGVVVARFLC
jgi:hypothetical protein